MYFYCISIVFHFLYCIFHCISIVICNVPRRGQWRHVDILHLWRRVLQQLCLGLSTPRSMQITRIHTKEEYMCIEIYRMWIWYIIIHYMYTHILIHIFTHILCVYLFVSMLLSCIYIVHIIYVFYTQDYAIELENARSSMSLQSLSRALNALAKDLSYIQDSDLEGSNASNAIGWKIWRDLRHDLKLYRAV